MHNSLGKSQSANAIGATGTGGQAAGGLDMTGLAPSYKGFGIPDHRNPSSKVGKYVDAGTFEKYLCFQVGSDPKDVNDSDTGWVFSFAVVLAFD